MKRNLNGTDRGKRVLTNDGEAVGTVVRVTDRRAHVLLDPEADATALHDPDTEQLDYTVVRVARQSVAQRTSRVVRLEPEADLTGSARS